MARMMETMFLAGEEDDEDEDEDEGEDDEDDDIDSLENRIEELN